MSPTAKCDWCNVTVPVEDGHLVRHAIGSDPLFAFAGKRQGDRCPRSGRVPFREGTPDLATVKRHLQFHAQAGVTLALFEVRSPGDLFSCILGVSTVTRDGVEFAGWAYGVPLSHEGKTHGGPVTPPPAGQHWQWLFRPIDLDSGEARPWIDAEAM